MLRLISDWRESPPTAIIEAIRRLHWQKLLNRILVNFPLPELREKAEADK